MHQIGVCYDLTRVDCVMRFSYLRLKFSSVSEAARAVETLKAYQRDGLELTVKSFGEDDSEGSLALGMKLVRLPISICVLFFTEYSISICKCLFQFRVCIAQIPPGSTRHVRRVEPMHFGCVELVEQHSSTRSTRRAQLARLA